MSTAEYVRSELRRVAGEFRDAETAIRNLPSQVPPAITTAVTGPANDLADGCGHAASEADRIEIDIRSDAAVQQARDDWISWADTILETIDDLDRTEIAPEDWSCDGAVAYANARAPQGVAATFVEQLARTLADELETYGKVIADHQSGGYWFVGEAVIFLISIVGIALSGPTLGISGVLGIIGLVGSIIMLIKSTVSMKKLVEQMKDSTPFDELLATISSTPSLRSGEWPYALRAKD